MDEGVTTSIEPISVPIDAIATSALDTNTFAIGSIIWVVVFLALLVYTILGGLLAYHWLEYMRYKKNALTAIFMYVLVGIVLFTILAASAALLQ